MAAIDTTFVSGSRFYFRADDPGTMLPGVTSVLSTIPKDFLRWWYAKMAAQRALESLDYIGKMAAVNEYDAIKYIAGAANSYTKSRSKIGSAAHDAFERMIRGENLGFVERGIENHVRHFGQFLDVMQPELLDAENVSWSGTHGYAGSFDAILRIKLDDKGQPDPQGDPATVVCDYKTSKDTYPDVAAQLAAYANADRIIDADGNSTPMPAFDGGLVVHVKEDMWAAKPVAIDQEVFDLFLACLSFFNALRVWDGEGRGRTRIPGLNERVIGKPIAGSDLFQSGTERRG